jgi:hypothetical protein
VQALREGLFRLLTEALSARFAGVAEQEAPARRTTPDPASCGPGCFSFYKQTACFVVYYPYIDRLNFVFFVNFVRALQFKLAFV